MITSYVGGTIDCVDVIDPARRALRRRVTFAAAQVEPRDVARARWRGRRVDDLDDDQVTSRTACYRPGRHGPCRQPAGARTNHPGYGACRSHGGGSRAQEGAWRVAHELAAELDVTPWDSLLLAVRSSAARRAWLHRRYVDLLGEDAEAVTTRRATGEDLGELPSALRPEVTKLLRELRAEERHMAVVSHAAIHAGVAERIVQQVELDGVLVAEAIAAGLDALQLDGDARIAAFAAAHGRLELEARQFDGGST